MQEVDFNEIRVFENYEIIEEEKGHAIITTTVTKSALNLYGFAHGGFLYTLCDSMSGLVARSTGVDIVTLNATMNYIKTAQDGDYLKVEGTLIHDGRTTKVVEVTVTNESDTLICKGNFTMYVTSNK